jgi:type I site-specific restriction-modification system R (restriction) subunit
MDGRCIRVKDMATTACYINFKGTPILYSEYSTKLEATNRNIELAGTKLRDYTYSSALNAWVEGYLS